MKNKYIYSLLNDKKYAQNIWSWDLVHEEPYGWLSSRTPQIPFNLLSRTYKLSFSFKQILNVSFSSIIKS